ncbi:MAG TPA: nitroreductase family protein [bacterium]|nr:nitroreductase family protein [bacterium]HOL49677.1 nitroreductase family protein [bacterium]HPO52486.1 nitroreductase family protein [bacterium]HXK45037.1 nitroreductase family protein [bacterium]
MEFCQVIKTRRSIRKYTGKEIDEEVLRRVLDAARIAPSGSNRQPWKFIVVKDSERKNKLAQLCHNQFFIAEAPVVIVACGRNIHYNRGGWMGDCSVLVDVAIAVDHLTLAARAEGLGTCWIGLFDNTGTKKFLEIPDDVNVVALTPLGYPAHRDQFMETSDRLPLEEIVFFEKWGKK